MKNGLQFRVPGLFHRIEMVKVAWNDFWFMPAEVTPLAAIRVCSGLVLLYIYLFTAFDLQNYLGTHSWIDAAAIEQLRHTVNNNMVSSWWVQSIWFYIGSERSVEVASAVFLVSIVCFTLGIFTRASSIAVWIGHLSFIHRAFLSWSGMDTVLAMILFYLLFAPCGAVYSLDSRWRESKGTQSAWSANTT